MTSRDPKGAVRQYGRLAWLIAYIYPRFKAFSRRFLRQDLFVDQRAY